MGFLKRLKNTARSAYRGVSKTYFKAERGIVKGAGAVEQLVGRGAHALALDEVAKGTAGWLNRRARGVTKGLRSAGLGAILDAGESVVYGFNVGISAAAHEQLLEAVGVPRGIAQTATAVGHTVAAFTSPTYLVAQIAGAEADAIIHADVGKAVVGGIEAAALSKLKKQGKALRSKAERSLLDMSASYRAAGRVALAEFAEGADEFRTAAAQLLSYGQTAADVYGTYREAEGMWNDTEASEGAAQQRDNDNLGNVNDPVYSNVGEDLGVVREGRTAAQLHADIEDEKAQDNDSRIVANLQGESEQLPYEMSDEASAQIRGMYSTLSNGRQIPLPLFLANAARARISVNTVE